MFQVFSEFWIYRGSILRRPKQMKLPIMTNWPFSAAEMRIFVLLECKIGLVVVEDQDLKLIIQNLRLLDKHFCFPELEMSWTLAR